VLSAICIPQFYADGAFDPDGFRQYLTRAEELGFESAWTQEQVVGTMPHLAPNEILSLAAGCTERLRLGCSVYVTSVHSPVHLAKSLATLDQISRGRLEVGIGTGGKNRMFPAFGITSDGFVSRFTEGLKVMRALWTQPRVNFEGRFWQLENAAMEPKPFQKPGPPVWFGGSAPAALRRAVRLADGFFGAGSTSTANFVEQVKTVRKELDEQGRDPATFRIAKRVYIAVDDDPERARERMSVALDQLYGYFGVPDITHVSVTGTPEDCVRGVQEVIDGGAERILFNPLFDESDQMERLSADIIPRLG
jgi:probable F420-dependent oxidoreductase